MSGKITKNTLFLTAAYIGQKIFSFVYFTLIARFIGAEKIGLYVTALSFSSLFSIFADLGLTQVLIREGARDKNSLGKILSQTIVLKIILALLAYGGLNAVIYLLGYSEELRNLIWVSGILMLLDAVTLSFYGVLRSLENLSFESLGVIIGQIIILVFGLIAVFLHLPIVFLLVALGMGSLFNLCFSVVVAYKQGIKLSFVLQKDLMIKLSRLAAPFALAGIFTKIYSYADSIMLSYLSGVKNVGLYSIPSKVVFAFQFIPMAFAASLYPAMSNFFVTDKEKLKEIFEKAFSYLLMLAAPLAVGVFVIAGIFIKSVYGIEFNSSVAVLQILTISLIFSFLDFPVGSLLNACNKQNVQTLAMGATMLVNITLNLSFIPWWGIKGAAVAVVLSNFLLLLVGLIWVPRVTGALNWRFWFKNLKIIISACVMGLFLAKFKQILALWLIPSGFLKTSVFLFVLIFLGVLFYSLILWITKILTKKDMADLFQIFYRKKYE